MIKTNREALEYVRDVPEPERTAILLEAHQHSPNGEGENAITPFPHKEGDDVYARCRKDDELCLKIGGRDVLLLRSTGIYVLSESKHFSPINNAYLLYLLNVRQRKDKIAKI